MRPAGVSPEADVEAAFPDRECDGIAVDTEIEAAPQTGCGARSVAAGTGRSVASEIQPIGSLLRLVSEPALDLVHDAAGGDAVHVVQRGQGACLQEFVGQANHPEYGMHARAHECR